MANCSNSNLIQKIYEILSSESRLVTVMKIMETKVSLVSAVWHCLLQVVVQVILQQLSTELDPKGH